MNTLFKLYLGVFCIVLSCLQASAQKTGERAQQLYENQEYYEAAGLYAQLYQKSTDPFGKADFAVKAGDCYAAFLQYETAAEWYSKAYEQEKDDRIMEKWADMLWCSGHYSVAAEKYKVLVSSNPSGEKYKLRANSCRYAMEEVAKTPVIEVAGVAELNSANSDYSPMLLGRYLLFSSARFDKDKNRVFSFDGQSFSDIYMARYDSAAKKWIQISKLPESINGKFNEGTSVYDFSTSKLLFMRCNETSGKGKLCRIYTSKIDLDKNNAGSSSLVDVGWPNISVGHPAISKDGKILFFVSDNGDGVGGKDIFVSVANMDGKWSIPENIGISVNTPGDEMFPVLSGDTMLYFSSNGHVGMGGLDIYKIKLDGKKTVGKAIPMPYPVNSAGDDFGICPLNNENGLFSSNRKNGAGSDDIYFYRPVPFVLSAKGRVSDKMSGAPISKALIIVKQNDEIVDTTLTDESGTYLVENLLSNTRYSIRAVKEGYIPQEKILSTYGENKTGELSKANGHDIDFELFKVTRDEIVINNIYYDFDKWDLRRESESELDKIVSLMNENREMKIQINSHTDDRGSDAYNIQLSANRAQAVVDYLVAKGIARERLMFKGWGESRLLISNAQTEEEHQLNRRTTFNLINAGDFSNAYYEKIYDEIEASNRKNRAGSFFRIYVGSESDEGFSLRLAELKKQFPAENTISVIEDGTTRVYMGAYLFIDEALVALDILNRNGFSQSYIAAFRNNQKIGLVKLQ